PEATGEPPRGTASKASVGAGSFQLVAGSGVGTWCAIGSGTGIGTGTISLARASAAVCQRFQAITTIPDTTISPPRKRTRYRGLMASRLAMKEYSSEPSGAVARHMTPAVTPAIHIEMT